mmetsp:Transcript_2165/g.3599  ORF Transcript_2165/g.3599 Transcript_2165/m.3599 type:complete len:103 (+) Transcript_2165:177-485(+)
MAFLAGLNSVERQLVMYGVGGYSLWSLAMCATAPKAHAEAHAEPAAAPKPAAVVEDKTKSVAAAAATPASAPAFEGKNDPMVLFALQDIQGRLATIEKALKL